jgi:hypothetical protein
MASQTVGTEPSSQELLRPFTALANQKYFIQVPSENVAVAGETFRELSCDCTETFYSFL